MFTDSLRKKGLLLPPGVLEEDTRLMTHTRAMGKTTVESMVSKRDSDRAEEELEKASLRKRGLLLRRRLALTPRNASTSAAVKPKHG